MKQAAFTTACHRVRAVISNNPMTHHVLALVLGIEPSEFRLMEARHEFPWGHFAAFVQRFPELDIDLSQFPEAATASIPAALEPLGFPTFNEMAAYMDAEMARMGVAQPVTDAWGATA
jgi:hypothetical protein